MIVVIQIAAVFGVAAAGSETAGQGLARYFGTTAMAYVWGIAVALGGVGLNRLGLEVELNGDVGQIGSYVCIGLAIPLLMFGANLKEIRLLTQKVLISFGAADRSGGTGGAGGGTDLRGVLPLGPGAGGHGYGDVYRRVPQL